MSTFSNLKFELIGTGDQSGTWGVTTNSNIGTAIEQAIVGLANPEYPSDANLTISLTNTVALQDARALVLNVTSAVSLTVTRELVVPTIQKQYIVQNNTTGSQSITVKTSAGSGITVPNGRKAHLYVNGTDVIQMFDFVDINGGAIDGTSVGAATPSTGAFTTLSASGTPTLSGLTASTALALDASKNVVSVTNTGTGNNVLATSPTLVTPALGTPSALTLTNATGLPVSTGISGLGSGVATFLATPSSANLAAAVTDETGSGAVVFATSPTLVTPALGTPTSATLTNATGLPVSTGISGLGSGVATFRATPSSANLAAAVSDETGSGAVVFATSPTLVTPALGTPSSATLTNATGLPVSTGISGLGSGVATFLATPSSANLAAAVSDETGSGALVFATSPTLVTPALGTPTSATLTNATGLPVSTGISGLGSGVATALAATANSSTGPVTGGGTATLSSKRIDPRVSSTASTSTLTPDISAFDQYNLTAQAASLTIAAPTGTPVDGNRLIIRLFDNGTAQSITWNGTYTAIGVTLPPSTTTGKTIYVGCVYNAAATRWDVVAVATQA